MGELGEEAAEDILQYPYEFAVMPSETVTEFGNHYSNHSPGLANVH